MKKMLPLLVSLFISLAMSCEQNVSVRVGRPPASKPDDKGKDKDGDKGVDKDKDEDEEQEQGKGPKKPKIDLTSLDQQCREVVLAKPGNKPFVLGELKERFLATHNEVRKIYGLNDLEWDNNIARYAQEWAEYLKKNNKCEMKHRSWLNMTAGKDYGENLAWNWTSRPTPSGVYVFTPEKSNYGWSKECVDYDYSSNSCKGKQCGHFTQVVWRSTKKVGCGVATCDGGETDTGYGRSEVWVCNYSPPGNYAGLKPF